MRQTNIFIVLIAETKMNNKRERIFVGMVEIAGYYSQLVKGLRKKGYPVTFIGGNFHPYKYEQPDKKQPRLVTLYDKVMAARIQTPRKYFFRKLMYIGAAFLLKLLIFPWSFLMHDVFIFSFGSSLLPLNVDLPFLSFFKKRIICNIAHGSEARPPYINGAYLDPKGAHLDANTLKKRSKKIRRRCDFIGRYADVVLGAPLSSQFLCVPFIDWFQIGIPHKIEPYERFFKKNEGQIRILHSPSHPLLKGTSKIRQTIRSLEMKGHKIKFVEITGKPNVVVMQELDLCDFVVDQLYSDTPMAGFATEAAWFGKPAVVGGYGWEILKKHIPKDMFPPSQICHPDNLEAAIEQLITDEAYRKELGKKARQFVQEKWSSECVVERYMQLINDTFPEKWLKNPYDYLYMHGAGLPEDRVKEIVRNLILAKGLKTLQLADKPLLERAFVEFAGLHR